MILLRSLAILAGLLVLTPASAQPGKPNVLFVISDDLNYMLSGAGHPECKTPRRS